MIDRLRFNVPARYTVRLIRAMLIVAVLTFFLKLYILLAALIILALVLPIVRLIWGKDPARDLSIKLGVIYGLGGSLIILLFIGYFKFLGIVSDIGETKQVRSDAEVEQIMEKYNRENPNNFRKPRYINQD